MSRPLSKLLTGISGFDPLSEGGLPEGRCTLVAGAAGSGKTVFALQYLMAGARKFNQPGVLVTFEEDAADLASNARSFGWDLEQLAAENLIAIIDSTPEPGEVVLHSGAFDLSALLARIESAVRSVGAKRVVLDAIDGLFPQFSDYNMVRRELHRVLTGLRRLGVTLLLTMERAGEEGVGRFGVEEFVTDNVVILRNRLEQERRRRTIEILRFRGAGHLRGEHPFAIDPSDGITISPRATLEPAQRLPVDRVSSGVSELDQMCGGGVYRGSLTLVSGATGTGKTILVTEYLRAALHAGERALLIGSEEGREQLTRNAAARGVDFEQAEADGLLRILCATPESVDLEELLLRIRREVAQFRPHRLAADSMSTLERVSSPRPFLEFLLALAGATRQLGITGLFTSTGAAPRGPETVTEAHLSILADTIILLRHVELEGELRRGLTILKMRGAPHDRHVREYVIDERCLRVERPFRGLQGILSGGPVCTPAPRREGGSEALEQGRQLS